MADGRDYVTRFKADTSGFKKGTEEIVEQLNKFNKALVDNQYKQRDCNKAISEAQKEIKNIQKSEEDRKKKIEELNKIIDKTYDEIEKLNSATDESGKLTEKQKKQLESLCNTLNKADKELSTLNLTEEEKAKLDEENRQKIAKLNEMIESERLQLSQLRTEQVGIRQAITETSRAVTENDKQWTVLRGTLANLASDTLQKLAAQIVSIDKDTIQTGEQFSASMSEVGAISGATAEEISELEEAARLYGATTKYSATEAAEALKYMALAGWDVEQSTSALGGILDLAAASGMDLAKASDMVTDYLSAFGMQAEQSSYLADLLTYAQGNSNTSAEQLGEAYRNCAANLNAAGQDVETVTSLLEAMANQGKKGSEAGTTLSAVMRDLTDKMDNGKIKIGETAVAVKDSSGNFRDLTDILSDVEAATDSMGTAERAAALSATFTAEAISGINLVLNEGMENVSGYEETLRNSTGAAADAAKAMSDNLSGDLKNLESAFDELKLKIYDSAETPLRNIVQLITRDGVAALEGIIKNLKTIIPVIVGATTAMVSLKASMAISKVITDLKKAFDAVTLSEVAAAVAAKGLKASLETLKADPVIAIFSVFTTALSVLGTVVAMNNDVADSVDNANEKTESYLETLQNLKEKEEENITSAEREAKNLKDLQSTYDSLRQKRNLTADEEKRLDTVAESLADTLGKSTEELKNKDGVYKELSKDIDEYIRKLREQVKFENSNNGLEEAYTAYDKATKAVQEYNSEIEKQKKIISDYIQENKEFVEGYESKRDSERSTEDINRYYAYIAKLDEENSKLNQLTNTQAGYRVQMIQATDAIIGYRKELGDTVDEEEVWDECGKDMNMTAEEVAETFQKVSTTETEVAKQTENTSKKVETLSEKYKRLNNQLAENESAIADVRAEIEEVQDEIDLTEDTDEEACSAAKERLEKLQSKLKDLNSEQTELKSRIKDVKDEIEKDANAIVDALDNVQDSAQALKSLQIEVKENHKISLNTLNSLVKKYPELKDLVNEYIGGVKTEKDVIEGLKSVYDRDVDNYNQALAVKLLKQNGFTEDVAKSVVELVNALKDDYGIDVQNFANANEVKKAALADLKSKAEETQRAFNDFWAENNFDIDMTNGNLTYIAKDSLTGQWREATQEEIARYKAILAKRDKAFDNYYSFDTQGVQKYMDLYNPVSADKFLDLSDNTNNSGGSDSGSGGSSDKGKNSVTLSGGGVSATADTYTSAYIVI